MSRFKQLLQASFKSNETEEWIDVHFTRPIGLLFALLWKRLRVHPNTVTILSMFLGVAAAVMFYHTDFTHNIIGVILLMFANFCDSSDGQLARLTGQKTLIGRILDGFSGFLWFASIYIALCLRLQNQEMPGTDMNWGVWIWVIAVISGVLCHSPQSSLSDYYRQIHLLFLKGKDGSEFDSYAVQRKKYEELPKKGHKLERMFHYYYANYCRSQEQRTPVLQSYIAMLKERYSSIDNVPEDVKNAFSDGSRPLIKYTNILTFNIRALCLYVSCLLKCPWLYFFIEIAIMSCIYIYMHKRHEENCEKLIKLMKSK
jgi:hypothetical protein